MYLFTEPPIKRKIEDLSQMTSEKTPLKQKKLDEDTLVTPPQSPFTQDNVNLFSLGHVLLYI